MKTETKLENSMRKIRIEKILLSAGATGDDLAKAKKLLELVSGKKAQILSNFLGVAHRNVCILT